jgi:murein DD-endopeptidase MepM/ murein hydrolase activator NlpD
MRRRVVAAIAVTTTLLMLAPSVPAAAAADTTWADVLAARGNEAATATKVTELTAALRELEAATAAARGTAEARGRDLQRARDAADAALGRYTELDEQAGAARAEAEGAEEQIAAWSAYLARGAGGDLEVAVASGKSTDLLQRLGTASKVGDTINTRLQAAAVRTKTAASLTAQADRAQRARDRLADAATARFTEAAAAATAAQRAEITQRDRTRTLNDQLAVLRDTTLSTEAAFADAERRRAAAAAAAARAAADRARAAAPVPATAPGAVSGSGWTRPITQYSSYQAYGNRLHPVLNYYRLHAGDDYGAACGTGLYAAAAGTVTFAGPAGQYGNLITVDTGGGVTANYAHMFASGVLVSVGQRVAAGQKIAEVGNAGLSTGCHLHFEIRQNGTAVPPSPFLAARGA